jgi:hypothetical protein
VNLNSCSVDLDLAGHTTPSRQGISVCLGRIREHWGDGMKKPWLKTEETLESLFHSRPGDISDIPRKHPSDAFPGQTGCLGDGIQDDAPQGFLSGFAQNEPDQKLLFSSRAEENSSKSARTSRSSDLLKISGDLRPPGAFRAFPQEKSFLLPASRSPHSLLHVNEIFEEHRISFYFPRQNPTRFRFVSGGGFEKNRRGRRGTAIAYFFDSLFLPLGTKRRRDPHRSILAKF